MQLAGDSVNEARNGVDVLAVRRCRFCSFFHPLPGHGFSVVELLVVLAVAAILFAAAAPSFYSLIQRQRLSATANEFLAAVHLARSEAIRRAARVDLVPAKEGVEWSHGWTVFVDLNGNRKEDEGDQVILRHGPVPEGMTIKASFTDSRSQYLAYGSNGRTRTNASSQVPQTGSWLFSLGKQTRRIVINFAGRPRICNPAVDAAC